MKPTEFEGHNVVFAKDQPEYKPLPAFRDPKDPNGEVTTCWELSENDLKKINETGKIYLSMWTFNNPLQPVRLTVENPLNL